MAGAGECLGLVAVEPLDSGCPEGGEQVGMKIVGKLGDARVASELEGLADEASVCASSVEESRPGLDFAGDPDRLAHALP